MPPRIDVDKCNGCEGLLESKCEQACPRNAIETRIPYQLGYYKATLRPFMGKNTITWKCTDIHGNVKEYKYRNRMDR